jgi:glycosyltransferase involved in cell wall biosynthesis
MRPSTYKYLRIMLPISLKLATKIFADSPEVASDLIRIFKVSQNRIYVIPPPIDTPVISNIALGNPYLIHPYLLAIATQEPRKRLPELLQAFDVLATHQHDLHLVILGKHDSDTGRITTTLSSLTNKGRVHVLGYVTQEEKWRWLRNADALISASIYEGFLMPAIEAMQLRVPVISEPVGILRAAPKGIYYPYLVADASTLVSAVATIRHGPLEHKTTRLSNAHNWAMQFQCHNIGRLYLDAL